MGIFDQVKIMLKDIPIADKAGRRYRAWQEENKIIGEQSHYERKAKKLGISKTYSFEEVRRELRKRLSRRNIYVKPKQKQEMHIVYASRPEPWDAQNVVPALGKFAEVTTYFYTEHGFNYYGQDWISAREKMNSHFVNYVKELNDKKPIDLILTYFSGRVISVDAIEAINKLGIVTSTFHFDDRLSFRGKIEGGRWTGPADVCKAYALNLTQAPESLVKYAVEGGIAMVLPLAANQDLFYPRGTPARYDVSFVGSAHGDRKSFVSYLKKNGISVETFGVGWPNSFISNEKVPEIFSSSRINLNFGDISYTNYQCGKSRDFEIPMSGGLMLTTHNKHLSDYFKIGAEIFTFRNKAECLRQVRRLLNDPVLCENARKKARDRAIREHTWEHRLQVLLEVIGFRDEKCHQNI